jgi:hypothetical protein
LEALFDDLLGAENRSLPKWPESRAAVTVSWTDAQGVTHDADHLEDLRAPYEEHATASIAIGDLVSPFSQLNLAYWPGPPRPRIVWTANGQVDVIDRAIEALTQAFPQPYEGPLVFVSWGGEKSRRIAEVLTGLLEAKLPGADVFFAPNSLEPGDDPSKRMIDEGLLRAHAGSDCALSV